MLRAAPWKDGPIEYIFLLYSDMHSEIMMC